MARGESASCCVASKSLAAHIVTSGTSPPIERTRRTCTGDTDLRVRGTSSQSLPLSPLVNSVCGAVEETDFCDCCLFEASESLLFVEPMKNPEQIRTRFSSRSQTQSKEHEALDFTNRDLRTTVELVFDSCFRIANRTVNRK